MLFFNNTFVIVMNFVLPFVVLMFINILGLTLDYKFLDIVNSDSYILNIRLINMVPKFLVKISFYFHILNR